MKTASVGTNGRAATDEFITAVMNSAEGSSLHEDPGQHRANCRTPEPKSQMGSGLVSVESRPGDSDSCDLVQKTSRHKGVAKFSTPNGSSKKDEPFPTERFENTTGLVGYFVWQLGRDFDDFTRDDFRQVGLIALWKVCQDYKESWEFTFGTYAGNAIKWAILRERGQIFRKRRRQRRFAINADGWSAEAEVELDSAPTEQRVADTEELQIIRDRVRQKAVELGVTTHYAEKVLLREAGATPLQIDMGRFDRFAA